MKAIVPQRMKDQRKYEIVRNECSRLVCFSILIALHQHMGIGAGRQDRTLGDMDKVQEEYALNIQLYGAEAARQKLMKQVEPYAPNEFTWPQTNTAGMSYKQRSQMQQLQDVKNDVATLTWCIFARCIRQHLGYGRTRFEKLRAKSEAILADLLQIDAEDGREVMWNTIDRLIRQANEKQAGFAEMTEEEMRKGGERWIRECERRAGQERLRMAQDKLIHDYKMSKSLNALEPKARELEDIAAQVRAENGLRATGMTRLKLVRRA